MCNKLNTIYMTMSIFAMECLPLEYGASTPCPQLSSLGLLDQLSEILLLLSHICSLALICSALLRFCIMGSSTSSLLRKLCSSCMRRSRSILPSAHQNTLLSDAPPLRKTQSKSSNFSAALLAFDSFF